MKSPAMNCSLSFPISISIILLFLLCSSPSSSSAASPPAEQPLLAPIHIDDSTRLYSISVYLKTPLQLTKLHLDLGASLSWVLCSPYNSSTYRQVPYNAPLCIELDTGIYGNCFQPPGPGCFNNSCEFFPENSVTRQAGVGDILIDYLALNTTDGRNPSTKLALDPNFVFSCGTTALLKGLARGVTGLAALGRFNFSLTAQLSRDFSSPFVFAICLPSYHSPNGVAIFNSYGPYVFLPGFDASQSLIYTPLILNPVGGTVITYVDRPSDEYFIEVTGIKVNGKAVKLNQTLLVINPNDGTGGTKVTTSTPYAVLQTSIFKAVTAAFKEAAAALNLKPTAPAGRFSLCYEADSIPSTRVGPAVPTIDLVLQSESVYWRIFGANSIVNDGSAACLGFLDGGASPRTSIVIGGLQMMDNLLQFDLVSKRLGFSSSLLFHSTTCSNFNFTTINS